MGGVSLRKHSLEVSHTDYRRESFHCEHSLQSLLEMEGENGPAPPSPSSSTSSPPMGGEIGGLKPIRKLGRQESPLNCDLLVTTKGQDTQTTKSKQSTANVDTSKQLSISEVPKKDIDAAPVETKFSPAQVLSMSEVKPGLGDNPQNLSRSFFERRVSKTKVSEKISVASTLKGLQHQQDSKKQSGQLDGEPAAKAQEKSEDNLKGNMQKSAEQAKLRKGSEIGEKTGICGASKASEITKVKGPVPPVPTHVQYHAMVRAKVEKVPNVNCGLKEERLHLDFLDENPTSPSPTAASPCSNKTRAMSPADKASFVTQLTSVAKTVLGPMKGASQEGIRVKDNSKSGEEKRANTTGKSEGSHGGGRWGAQTATSVQSEKGNSRSSKHHS